MRRIAFINEKGGSAKTTLVANLAAYLALKRGRRVLAGFDFPFGYPASVAQRLTGRAEALALWRWLAERIEDGADNANNRYAVAERINDAWGGIGPMWGRPAHLSLPGLPAAARERHGPDHPPERRLAAVAKLAAAGIPTYVSIAPVIPAITDHEIELLVARAAQAGARHAFFIPVRLPHEIAPLFRAWLDTHYPERAGKVMAIIRSLRGGRDNDPDFFTRMKGQGPWAELLRVRFHRACRLHGLNLDWPRLDISRFRPPKGPQGELF